MRNLSGPVPWRKGGCTCDAQPTQTISATEWAVILAVFARSSKKQTMRPPRASRDRDDGRTAAL